MSRRIALALGAVLPLSLSLLLAAPVGRAQGAPEPTPLLGTAVIVTPLVTAPATGDVAAPTTAPDQAAPNQTAPAQAATDAPTPAANDRPDRCEPNETRAAACALALDQVNGPYTVLPAGDQDWYRLTLAPTGLQTSITVRGTAGLDLLTTISRDDGTPLGVIASPAISTTLAPDIAGGVILRVENRAPQIADGERYIIEVRQALPPAPPVVPDALASPTPDALENNWSPATAAPIGVGVVYDLNLTCPVPWGCAGGDHDYFALPVKAGTAYLIATFDLGPGVDCVPAARHER